MTADAVVLSSLQMIVMVVLTPMLIGLMRQIRARLEGRVGAGIWQPWRDLRKLFAKEPLRAPGISWVQSVGPVLLMVSSLAVSALVPLISTVASRFIPADLFVVVSVLLLGTVALALVGLDAGTAFGGMGSSRHMTIAALVEPTILLAIYALSVPIGSSALGEIVRARIANPSSIISLVSLLAIVALAIATVAETSRMPVDNPTTHLELTMVHEAMVLESSGRDLAWLELGSWLRLTVLLGLIGSLLLPWGMATEPAFSGVLLGLVMLIIKLFSLASILSVTEVFLAKLRLFRVPELLAGSFVVALLAVVASYLMAGS